MRLSRPKNVTFWIAVILATLGLIGRFVAVLSPLSFWLVLAGFILLVLALLIKGL